MFLADGSSTIASTGFSVLAGAVPSGQPPDHPFPAPSRRGMVGPPSHPLTMHPPTHPQMVPQYTNFMALNPRFYNLVVIYGLTISMRLESLLWQWIFAAAVAVDRDCLWGPVWGPSQLQPCQWHFCLINHDDNCGTFQHWPLNKSKQARRSLCHIYLFLFTWFRLPGSMWRSSQC